MSRDKGGVVNPVVVGSSPTATARLEQLPHERLSRTPFFRLFHRFSRSV